MSWDYKNYKKFLPSKEALSPWLPSRNITITAAFLAFFIGWLFWVPTTETFQLKNIEFGKRLIGQPEYGAAAEDADRDGLKDWEESLWKTDPQNPDTDSDGASDGEEIKNLRNPTVAGPNDAMPKLAEIVEVPELPEYQPGQNLTEYIAKDFLIKYVAMKQKGLDPLEELPSLLAESIEGQYPEEEFTLDDIKIVNDNSAVAIKKYVNSLGGALKPYLSNDERMILQEFGATENAAVLAQLSVPIDTYKQIIPKLKTIPVPSVLSGTHLDFINAANSAKNALTNIQKTASDPSLALLGIIKYTESIAIYQEAAREISAGLKNNNIVLSSNDPGYMFMW